MSDDGLSVTEVGADVTVKVTGIETGCVPGALSVTLPVCVPTPSEPRTGAMVTVPVPVPEAGETVSQPALSLVVQVSVPPPVLRMLNCRAAGLLPPC